MIDRRGFREHDDRMSNQAKGESGQQRHCQTFPQGCVGCCVNMRWPRSRVIRFLELNTQAVRRILGDRPRPTLREMARLHRARGGILDHLLAAWLVVPTFGLSAFLWKRLVGSCCFSGFINETAEQVRVGCLIHPLRVGQPDLRRHAFPLVPTLGCDRGLRCAMLDDESTDFSVDYPEASVRGFGSL